ncbi:MAG: hypothetical protein IIB38_10640, partial [Candidatus Hydrogenedentes bacterium]|nr:hypothetical protein [Candidatus Hydrogenedentota bacterium]
MKRKTQVYLVAGAMAGIVLVASVYFLTMPMPPIVELKEMLESEVAALLEERLELDETVWAQEVAAQKHEETIVKYWDRMLRPEDDKYAVLAEFPFETITLDAPGETTEIDWGIKRTTYEGLWKTLDRKGWREFLREMEDGGYGIDSIEFHQSAFTADA